MKKFLTEISIAIVMISIGCMVCVFEFKDFRFMNAYANEMDGQYQTYTTTVNKENPLRIELDEYVYISYKIDDDAKDEVTIEVNEHIHHKLAKNKLHVSEYGWYSNSLGSYLDAWIDGLKEKKIYYFDWYSSDYEDEIIITCSAEAKKYIDVSY